MSCLCSVGVKVFMMRYFLFGLPVVALAQTEVKNVDPKIGPGLAPQKVEAKLFSFQKI